MEETISLQEIFEIIKKRLSLILISFFIVLGLASIMTFFVMDRSYSSSAQLIATLPKVEGQTSNVNDVNFNLQMINTYKDVVTSEAVLTDVQKILMSDKSYDGSIAQIRSMLSMEQNTGSQMFAIKATSGDPKVSQAVANAVSEVFQEKAIDLLAIDKITIMSEAPLNTSPVSPNTKLNLLIGGVLGVMLGIGLSFLVELLDKTVKDERFVRETVGLPILGVVPQMTEKELSNTARNTKNFNKSTGSSSNGKSTAVGRRQRSRV